MSLDFVGVPDGEDLRDMILYALFSKDTRDLASRTQISKAFSKPTPGISFEGQDIRQRSHYRFSVCSLLCKKRSIPTQILEFARRLGGGILIGGQRRRGCRKQIFKRFQPQGLLFEDAPEVAGDCVGYFLHGWNSLLA